MKIVGTREELDALADRLMGRGMLALKSDDWGLLCVALEDAVRKRSLPPVDFHEALQTAKAGMAEWRSQAHNRRWWRRIDGTPIPNDLMVRIAMKFVEVFGEAAPEAAHAPNPDDISALVPRTKIADRVRRYLFGNRP